MERIEDAWIIVNPNIGAYVDWRIYRKEMIEFHCKQKGMTWKQARAKGDRAVKAKLIYDI